MWIAEILCASLAHLRSSLAAVGEKNNGGRLQLAQASDHGFQQWI